MRLGRPWKQASVWLQRGSTKRKERWKQLLNPTDTSLGEEAQSALSVFMDAVAKRSSVPVDWLKEQWFPLLKKETRECSPIIRVSHWSTFLKNPIPRCLKGGSDWLSRGAMCVLFWLWSNGPALYPCNDTCWRAQGSVPSHYVPCGPCPLGNLVGGCRI